MHALPPVETEVMPGLGWIPVLLRETVCESPTAEQLQQRLANNREIRRWGSAKDLLGALRFLCNVGFVEEKVGHFTITPLGKGRLATFGNSDSHE